VGGPAIDVAQCVEILARGRRHGVHPRPAAIARAIMEARDTRGAPRLVTSLAEVDGAC
jgi:hypothetical protein